MFPKWKASSEAAYTDVLDKATNNVTNQKRFRERHGKLQQGLTGHNIQIVATKAGMEPGALLGLMHSCGLHPPLAIALYQGAGYIDEKQARQLIKEHCNVPYCKVRPNASRSWYCIVCTLSKQHTTFKATCKIL